MNRLTARTEKGLAYLVNVKPDEQVVDSPHKNTLQCILDCFERLAQYEDAEEQGRCVVLPCVDAVPVVRGEWIVDECDTSDDVPSYSWIDFHCSECSTDYGLEEGQYGWYRCEKIPYNYCPNCGAKMDGEKEGV